LIQEVGIVTSFDQIEPSSFKQQILADGPSQAQVEFRSHILARLSGRVLQTGSDEFVFGLSQPPEALLEDGLDILQRFYGHEIAGGADIRPRIETNAVREREILSRRAD
jgi:hypothetical protein